MGLQLISFYQNKVRKSWKIAFYSAFLGFLLVHLYKITNFLPNHDSFFNVYVDQDMTRSGRWFLQYACGISSYFDLPWLNGLLCACYIGIASAFVTALFDIENPIVIILSSLILAACPSTTETMFFGFTADGYFLGMAMCAAAAYFSARGKHIRHYVLSGILLCLSLAVYQTYISFAIVLCACYIIRSLLENQVDVKAAWKWVARHAVIYLSAAACYYILWKLILLVTGQQANSYQGIDQVGNIQLSTLFSGAIKSLTNLFFFYLEWNILEHPLTLYGALNILFLLSFACVLLRAIILNRVAKNIARLLTVLLFLAACIPAISLWNFLSEGVQYRPMMLHSAVVFYLFFLLLADNWLPPMHSTICGLLMAVMVFNFGVMANIAYNLQTECYARSCHRGAELMECIEEADTEDVTQIAFVGKASTIFEEDYIERIHILSHHLEPHLLYDNVHSYLFLKHTFALDIPQAASQEIQALEASQAIQTMSSWPQDGSVQIVDGTLVIKLGDIP